jgi:heme exporter protein A
LTSPLLEAVALSCERDLRLLFEHLELRLAGGDMVQVSGPNGSGKTSLLRLLAGLMQPTAGEVRLNGKPLNEQRTELARNLVWIGHAAGIKDVLTAEENLSWLSALHHPASRDAIWQALAAVGLKGFEDVPCHTLSAREQRDDDGEEHQRVCQFRRATAQQPRFAGDQQGEHAHADHRPKSRSR